jgi:Fe-S-cluster containining protein
MPAQNGSKRQRNFFDTCSQCRTSYSCCNDTTPPISSERRKIIEAYLKKNKIRILNPFAKTGYVFPRISEDGYCVFHDKETKKCLVHPVKPETCVAGPITFDINVKNQKIEWYIKMEKICQLAQVVYEDKELLGKHLNSAKREILRLVKELDSEALKAILERAEPETLKIGEDGVEKKVLGKLACR